MKNLSYLFIGIIIGGCLVFGFVNYNIKKESTIEIDNKITEFNKKISLLDNEIEKYQGGIILSLLKTQRAIYTDIIAALEVKKAQMSHWIILNYQVATEVTMPVGEIQNYDTEISRLQKKIDNDKEESAQYKPCLVKSLIETRIAQTKLALSGLERAKIAKQYNLPFLLIPGEKATKDIAPKINQSPEQDKDAL